MRYLTGLFFLALLVIWLLASAEPWGMLYLGVIGLAFIKICCDIGSWLGGK